MAKQHPPMDAGIIVGLVVWRGVELNRPSGSKFGRARDASEGANRKRSGGCFE